MVRVVTTRRVWLAPLAVERLHRDDARCRGAGRLAQTAQGVRSERMTRRPGRPDSTLCAVWFGGER